MLKTKVLKTCLSIIVVQAATSTQTLSVIIAVTITAAVTIIIGTY